MLPPGMTARVDTAAWSEPAIFEWLRDAGNVARDEMYRTFNCGIGMVVCVAPEDEAAALAILRGAGEDAFTIGEVAGSGSGNEKAPAAVELC